MKVFSKLCGLPTLVAFLALCLATSCTSVQADVVLPEGVRYAQAITGADGVGNQTRQIALCRVGAAGWVIGTASVVGLIPCIFASNNRETVDIEIDRSTLEASGVSADRTAEILDRGWNRLRGTVRVASPSAGSGACRIEVPMRKFVDAAVTGTEQHYTPALTPFATVSIRRVARR